MKYIVTKTTPIYKGFDSQSFGIPTGGRIDQGTIIEVVSTGSGGRGIIAEPYLFLQNGTHLSGYSATPVNEESIIKYVKEPSDQIPETKPLNALAIIAVIGVGLYLLSSD